MPMKARAMKMRSNIGIGQGLSLAILLVLTSLAGFAQESGTDGWKVVGPGGGGTTIGPTISPFNSCLVAEHCDMTGGDVTSEIGRTAWRERGESSRGPPS